jgi:hypothetical protein
MFPNHHPCIDASEHESLSGLSHHPMEDVTNTKKGVIKKTCQTTISKGSHAKRKKGYVKPIEHQLKKIWNMMV